MYGAFNGVVGVIEYVVLYFIDFFLHPSAPFCGFTSIVEGLPRYGFSDADVVVFASRPVHFVGEQRHGEVGEV